MAEKKNKKSGKANAKNKNSKKNIKVTTVTETNIVTEGNVVLKDIKDKYAGVRSMFAVWNNPDKHYIYKHDERTGQIVKDENDNPVVLDVEPTVLTGMSPSEMCQYVVDKWCHSKPNSERTAACVYCISEKGLHHLHIVFECANDDKFTLTTVQKLFNNKMHGEVTRGTKKQVEDYIWKQGTFEEKGEDIVARYQHGDLKGNQGQRSDLMALHKMIFEENKTPDEILSYKTNASYFEAKKYATLQNMFMYKKKSEIPVKRDVYVSWDVGGTGSGKTYQYQKDFEEHGQYGVFRTTNYLNGWLDNYVFQKIAYFDEFRGGLTYSQLLDLTEGYKSDFHCRGTNNDKPVAWETLHICSPYFPDGVYNKMVSEAERGIDSIAQIMRRIKEINYFAADVPGEGPFHKWRFKGNGWEFFQKYKFAVAGVECNMNDYFLALIDADSPFIEKVY